MTEHQPSDQQDDTAAKGGLDPAPVTPTEEKEEPEAGTGSTDKRSPESVAEQDESPAGSPSGEAGGDITR